MLNALFGGGGGPNVQTGTTSPIPIPRGGGAEVVKPGEYFVIKVYSAQAAFRGSIFDRVQQLVVTSRVNLHHPALGNEEVFAIQRSREVRRDQAVQLGLSQNLVSLVPATMTHVTVSIDFILDTESRLAVLGTLINNDAFLAAVSLAPGAAAVAKTIGGLAQQVIQTFIPAQRRQPILQFAGDFNLGTGANDLTDGYYAILGSQSQNDPIPNPMPALEVRDGALLAGGQGITQLSYVVLSVVRVPVRTRELSSGAVWDTKLREAEVLSQEVTDDPFADDARQRENWNKCVALLQEARALLLADPNYAEAEAGSIYKTSYKQCADLIRGTTEGAGAKRGGFTADTKTYRELLGIATDDNLESVVADYANKESASRQLLRELV